MKALLALVLLVGCKADVGAAKKSAEEFTKSVPHSTGYSCNESDSDGDGYCSCTVFRDNQDPLPIACGCERFCVFNCASGCKYVGGRVVQ